MADYSTEDIADSLRCEIGKLVHSKYTLKNTPELNERMRKIILWRYRLDEPYAGFEPSLQNIGDIFGISAERVSQIERKVLRMLRHPSRRKAILELE